MMHTDTLEERIFLLLEQSGCATRLLSIEPCAGGKNNRTYRIETDGGRFAIKKYFQQPGDQRHRLAAEFAFLQYANRITPKQVPTPFGYDAENNLALYEFIDGTPCKRGMLTGQDIQQAIDFFCALNTFDARQSATTLPPASEACFSVQSHIDVIDRRLHELQKISPESEQDRIALDSIKQLTSSWRDYTQKISHLPHRNALLDNSQRCLSPSDFGFHNTLRRADGTLCFLDFEYAGWDDPAKMTGDFFAQLEVPVPPHCFDDFVTQVMMPFTNPEALIKRAYLLRYIYQIKWCCIALNIFLPVHLARRRFSNPTLDVTAIKTAQLDKVSRLMISLEQWQHDND